MCGRYTDTKRDKEFLTRIGVQDHPEFLPRYNLAPTQDAWVAAREDDGVVRLRKMRWGLVPFWSKDAAAGSKMINARSETAAEKPAYRQAFRRRRCLVLADGFYEWRATPHGKIPHYIRLKDGKPFVFAGLWETWRGPEGPLETFCVLTGGANELVMAVHDRMPVILNEDHAMKWLVPQAGPEELKGVFKPYPAAEMEFYPVSKLVNSPAHESPECLTPVEAGAAPPKAGPAAPIALELPL